MTVKVCGLEVTLAHDDMGWMALLSARQKHYLGTGDTWQGAVDNAVDLYLEEKVKTVG